MNRQPVIPVPGCADHLQLDTVTSPVHELRLNFAGIQHQPKGPCSRVSQAQALSSQERVMPRLVRWISGHADNGSISDFRNACLRVHAVALARARAPGAPRALLVAPTPG